MVSLTQGEIRGLRRADLLLACGRAPEARAQVRALLSVDDRARAREAGRERQAALAAAQLCLFDAWPDEQFNCPLHGRLRYRACVARQVYTDSEKPDRDPEAPPEVQRHWTKRGIGYTLPACDSERCGLGRTIREHFGDECADGVRDGERART